MEEQEIRRRRGNYQLLDEEKEEYDDQEQEKIIQELKNDFENTIKLQNTIFSFIVTAGIGIGLLLMIFTFGIFTYIPGIILEFALYLIPKHRNSLIISFVFFSVSLLISFINPEHIKSSWRIFYNIILFISMYFKKYAYNFSVSMPEQIKHLESLKYPNPKA